MNSRGDLLTSEVLKIVVAVICIGFLVYFLSALYYSKINSQKTVEARSSLDQIKFGIENMKQNSLTDFEVDSMGPSGWWFFGFVSPENKPNFCSGKSCLCICKKSDGLFGDNLDKQLERCDEDGACEIVSALQDFEEFKLGESEGAFSGARVRSVVGGLEVERI